MSGEAYLSGPAGKFWRFDGRITLSVCFSVLGSLVTVVFLAAALSTRVEHLETRAKSLELESGQLRSVMVGVARLEERLEAMQRTLENMRADMRGRERAGDGGRFHGEP